MPDEFIPRPRRSAPQSSEPPVGPPKHPSRTARRVGIVAGLVVLLLLSTVLGFSLFKHETPLQLLGDALIPSPQQVFGRSQLRVLVVGLDYDYTDNDLPFSAQARSDVIWAVNLDLTNKRIFELSVPRDMVATMPDGSQAKINQAQADGGVQEAEQVISHWLGIPGFDRYVILRINATRELIDDIGGVTVDVENSDPKDKSPINYDDNWGHLHIHLKTGIQHLTGAQAVGYMRYRHDWCGDPCRIRRQQEVLHALASKLQRDKFNTLLHAGQLVRTMLANVQTNFSKAELLSLAHYYVGIKPSQIIAHQVPYVANVYLPGYGDAIVPDKNARRRLVESMLIAPPSPAPTADPAALAAIAPSSLRVDVENGSGIDGAAADLARVLKAEGYRIGQVGNSASYHDNSVVRAHSGIAFAGDKVASGLPKAMKNALIVESPAEGTTSDVTVVIGRDDGLAVHALPSPGASPTP